MTVYLLVIQTSRKMTTASLIARIHVMCGLVDALAPQTSELALSLGEHHVDTEISVPSLSCITYG